VAAEKSVEKKTCVRGVGGRGAGTELIGERALLHLFGEITYRVKNLRSLSECCIPRPTRTLASRCGDTFPFGCF
jgi:hypothetical protein